MIRKISTKWVLAVLAVVVVPFVGFALFVDTKVTQRLAKDVVEFHLLSIAADLASRLDEEIDERRKDVAILAQEPIVSWFAAGIGDDRGDFRSQVQSTFNGLVKVAGVYEFVVAIDAEGNGLESNSVDSQGRVIPESVLRSLREQDYDRPENEWFQRAMRDGSARIDFHSVRWGDEEDGGIGSLHRIRLAHRPDRRVGGPRGPRHDPDELEVHSGRGHELRDPPARVDRGPSGRRGHVRVRVRLDLVERRGHDHRARGHGALRHARLGARGWRAHSPRRGRARRGLGHVPRLRVSRHREEGRVQAPEAQGAGWLRVGRRCRGQPRRHLRARRGAVATPVHLFGRRALARRAVHVLHRAPHDAADPPLAAAHATHRARRPGHPDRRGDQRRARRAGARVQPHDDRAQGEPRAAREGREGRGLARDGAAGGARIKNPLTPISVSTGLLKRSRDEHSPDFDSIFDRTIELIQRQVENMREITRDFYAFAGEHRAPRPSNIGTLLDDVLDLHAAQAEEQGIHVHRSGDGGTVHVDPGEMRRALVNLVTNALEAMPDGGELFVSSRGEGDEVHVEIRDTGPGVSAEAAERLFEPYFTTRSSGTGLGLAIVRRVVEDLGGRVSLRNSETGTGAVARIVLPVHA